MSEQTCTARFNWPRRYFVIAGVRIRVDRQLQRFGEQHQVWLGVTIYPKHKGEEGKLSFSSAREFVAWMRRCKAVSKAKAYAGVDNVGAR